MYDSQTIQPYTGTHVLQVSSSAMWKLVLWGSNIGGAVLVLLLMAGSLPGSVVPGLVTGLIIWFVANAILIPLSIVRMRKRLILDFDAGTLTANGVTNAPSELRALIQTSRHFMGMAYLLTFDYARGNVDVQIEGFAPTAESRARNAALTAFIWQCLPVPEQHAQYLRTELTLVKHLIGKREATALLQDRMPPVP